MDDAGPLPSINGPGLTMALCTSSVPSMRQTPTFSWGDHTLRRSLAGGGGSASAAALPFFFFFFFFFFRIREAKALGLGHVMA